MLKKIFILLSIITVASTEAMNEPMDIEETSSNQVQIEKHCSIKEFVELLISLPSDVQNYIAQLLTFEDIESAEEFITRTKNAIKKTVPKKYYYKDFKAPSYDFSSDLDGGLTPLRPTAIAGFCPNEIYLALLPSGSENLNIINTRNDHLLCTEDSPQHPNTFHKNVAISRGTHMVATIIEYLERNMRPRRTEEMRYITTDTVTIKNIATLETEEHVIPSYFKIPNADYPTITCDFKKEGTHIILHGIDHSKTENQTSSSKEGRCPEIYNKTPHHLIFPVTVNGPYTGPNKKTLLHYLANKMMTT
jgi:hypothetical protein